MANYDVGEVTAAFLNNALPGRAELVLEIGKAVREQRVVKRLCIQVAEEAVAQQANPATTIQIGLMYGMVIGILLEKERAERQRRLV